MEGDGGITGKIVPEHCRSKYTLSAALPGCGLIACLFFAACGPRYDDAAELERQGRALAAAAEYGRFALKEPADPRAPEALLKAGRLYAEKLCLCAQSRPLLERLVRNYPEFKVPEADFRLIFVCPDYFPSGAGRSWVYGDSQTLGRNARRELLVTGAALYAGEKLVSRRPLGYYFSGRAFYERQGGFDTIILSYPLEKGKTWTSRGPEGPLEFSVEETGLRVKVKAGEFADCVKVRRRVPGRPSWILDYYAPWTGKVATAAAGDGYEHRVMELLTYDEKK